MCLRDDRRTNDDPHENMSSGGIQAHTKYTFIPPIKRHYVLFRQAGVKLAREDDSDNDIREIWVKFWYLGSA